MFVKVLLEIGADPNLNTEWEKKIPTDQYASIAKGRLRQLIMSYVTCKMELKDVQTNTYEYEI